MSSIIGETAAKVLDGLREGDQVVACAVVAVVDNGDGDEETRVRFSDGHRHVQLGLLEAAREAMDDQPDEAE